MNLDRPSVNLFAPLVYRVWSVSWIGLCQWIQSLADRVAENLYSIWIFLSMYQDSANELHLHERDVCWIQSCMSLVTFETGRVVSFAFAKETSKTGKIFSFAFAREWCLVEFSHVCHSSHDYIQRDISLLQTPKKKTFPVLDVSFANANVV